MEYMSKEGFDKIASELQQLETVELAKVKDAISEARDKGDLSENFEYKAAKQAQNKNRSRIRYLEGMIKSAKVIDDRSASDEVGLFDKVEIYIPEDDDTQVIQVVTTVRCDPLHGLISKESPVGKALMGRKVGDRVQVEVNPQLKYFVEVRAIEKGKDDESMEISAY